MKHFNRAAAILVCLFIIAAPLTRCFYSYADTTTDNWESVTTNAELVDAFRYYCKSRDLTIEGSIADGVTSFTTQTFNNICNVLGYDLTALQAHLKKETDGSNVRYLFDSTGITAYNAIFAQFLQDNDLSVGDSADENNNTVYTGEVFTDNNGTSCLVWYLTSGSANGTTTNIITNKGSYYLYNPEYIASLGQQTNLTFYLTFADNTSSTNYTKTVYYYKWSDNTYRYAWNSNSVSDVTSGTLYSTRGNGSLFKGGTIIARVNNGNLSLMSIGIGYGASAGKYWSYTIKTSIYPYEGGNNVNNCTVYLTTNNKVINNNNYEGDTIIGDDNEPDPGPSEPSGGTPPNWDLGGGEGTAEDGNGNTWNITWPSFELPDLNIDWSINGLSEKFPFSIPFDLVALVTVLSAEPEAPQFTGTVDLKVYQWNYDLDFSQFNTVAAVFRTAETLLFVFGLIMITRKIIRG